MSYEREFGAMSFDQYEVQVDEAEEVEAEEERRKKRIHDAEQERLRAWLDQQ